ncbi:hypothetical protein ACS0TY_005204 [Phlomoides rotata]
MGNSPPHRLPPSAGKVILSDGGVFTYDEPLTVAELMLEHPRQVVVELTKPMTNGGKPTPLPADQKLETEKTYLMLPIRKGKPIPLSSEAARKVLESANSVLKSKALVAFTGVVPLLVRMNDAVSKGKKSKCCLVEGGKEEKSDYFVDVMEGRPEFLSRQISGKGWKPSLDPITEKAFKAKVSHWVLNK